MLEHKPHHVRRKIAFICTIAIAAILVAVLVLHYTKPAAGPKEENPSPLKDFYNTLSEDPQSPFKPE
jgi:hypothetical protein